MLRDVHEALVFITAAMAGGINSVAGGGSLVTFPTLIWLGVPTINANATTTVAIWVAFTIFVDSWFITLVSTCDR